MHRGERFNSLTHLIGAVLALAGLVVLLLTAARQGDPWKTTSFAVYGTALLLLYVCSVLFHSLRGRAKAVFRKLDHCAIYLLIAGTYTPFALVTLRGAWGWTLFGIVWGFAFLGILQELLVARGARIVSLVIYLSMGWCALIAAVPLADALSLAGFAWVLAGGVVYTVGVVFYAYDHRLIHGHGVWHLCVLGGSGVHFGAILAYVA